MPWAELGESTSNGEVLWIHNSPGHYHFQRTLSFQEDREGNAYWIPGRTVAMSEGFSYRSCA